MPEITLDLIEEPTLQIPSNLLDNEPTFVLRYWLVAEIISQITQGKYKNKKIIDVGGNGSLLPEMLKKKIDILDLPDSDYENYTKASALEMPFRDNAYEIVTACDVYEHITQQDRAKFIDEILRITKNYAIVCGPMSNRQTSEAEKRTNDFFRNIFDTQHPWLEEHINYGLPSENGLEKILKENNLRFKKISHGDLLSWEIMTKTNFLMVANEIANDSKIADEIKDLNRLYTKKLGHKDFPKTGYRTLYIIEKTSSNPISEIRLPSENTLSSRQIALKGSLVLEKIAISFRGSKRESDSYKDEAALQEKHNQHLKSELETIYASRSWKLVSVLRKVAAPIYRFLRKTQLTRLIKKIKRLIFRILLKIPVFNRSFFLVKAELQRQRRQRQRENEYAQWLRGHKLSEAQLEEQKNFADTLKNKPLISVILPTYNTNPQHLRECIDSIINQTYKNWELCIADDASTKNEVREIIEKYKKGEPRIKTLFRSKNGHISSASNSALSLAGGEFVALMDHDDVLWPNALYEVVKEINNNQSVDFIYSDEDKIDEQGHIHSQPFFKPDWSPDFLRSLNYITHLAVIKRSLISKVGGFRQGYEGAQDWDLFLRVTKETNNISHIPKILYSWRQSKSSTALNTSAKDYAYDNQKKALIEDAKQRGLNVKSMKWAIKNLSWEPEYEIKNNPMVSIIIPTKDKLDYIKKCLNSIRKSTTYKNIEILVVDTGSTDKRVLHLYDRYRKKFKNFKVLNWEKPFNFSTVCNFGASNSAGKYLLFLNNDTEVVSKNWIQGMLQYAQQPQVGAVGCKLLYPNGKLQHAGVVLGVGGSGETPGVAGHLFPGYQDQPFEDWAQCLYAGSARDFSAVTAACMLVQKQKFKEVKGFDERFQIAWNDVDFCLKLREKGYYNIYTPYVKLYHNESVSVGLPGSKTRSLALFRKEIELFGEKWGWGYINNDPFYNPNFRKDIASARLSFSK